MITKPTKDKRQFIRVSNDFSEKEVYEVSLLPFNASNGRELVNLRISARIGNKADNSYRGSASILTLTQNQLNDLEKAIQEYQNKKILPEAIIL